MFLDTAVLRFHLIKRSIEVFFLHSKDCSGYLWIAASRNKGIDMLLVEGNDIVITSQAITKDNILRHAEQAQQGSGRPAGPVLTGRAMEHCGYWDIENGAHQRLDNSRFQEDKSRVRNRNSAHNLSLFRRAALPLARHWINHQSNPRLATTNGFFGAMKKTNAN
jgi:hypothetical protein